MTLKDMNKKTGGLDLRRVTLTSLKRKVSLQAETVGGPVDVAVLSKRDGFVWIRRKQYFKEELNQHMVLRD